MDSISDLPPKRKGLSDRGDRNSRSKLKDFYGISAETPGAGMGGPLDVNESQFSVETYMAKMQQDKTLLSLAKVNLNLISEIKTLDGDMKTLVYENYERFLTATDTMKNIRKTLEVMQSEMTILSAKMSEISLNSYNLSSAFSEKSLKMRSLNNKQVLLHKVQYIFDFPSQLKMYLTQAKFMEAIKSYHKIADVLERYGDIPAFSKLKSETNDILKDLCNKATNRLKSQVPMQEMAECISCLAALKYNPLELGRQYMKAASQALKGFADHSASVSVDEASVANTCSKKINMVRKYAELFLVIFIPLSVESVKFGLRFDKDYQLYSIMIEMDIFKLLEAESTEWTDSLVSPAFAELRNLVAGINDAGDFNASIMKRLNVVERFHHNLDIGGCKHTRPALLIKQKANDLYLDMIRLEIRRAFVDLRSVIDNVLCNISDYSISKFEGNFNVSITALASRIAVIASVYSTESFSYQKAVKGTVRQEMYNFWVDVVEQLKSFIMTARFSIKPVSEEVHSVTAIFFIALLCECCTELVKLSFYQVFRTEVPIFMSQDDSGEEIDDIVAELTDTLKVSASYFKRGYVRKCVKEMIMHFEAKCDSGDYADIWPGIQLKLETVEHDLESLFNRETRILSDDSEMLKRTTSFKTDSSTQLSQMGRSLDRFRTSSLSSSTPLSSKLSGNLKPHDYMNNIDRLLSERMEFFNSKIPNTKTAVTTLIVKLVLKASVELYRLLFSGIANSKAQVQNDIKFVRNNLGRYMDDERLFLSLVDEMTRTTSLRMYMAE